MFYLINKPKGITSFFALKKIRARLGVDKIWHTGTLDPLASGLLLVATEQSTKLIPYLEKARKTYTFTMRMDGWTESGDLEKEVQLLDNGLVEEARKILTTESLEKLLTERFHGKISQIPSKFSAIKVDGKAAYHAARKGKEVIIPEREIEIFSMQLLDFSFPEATIKATVSAGTYIRTLASDIAKSLGLDAYLTSLERIEIGHLSLSQGHDIETLAKEEALSYEVLFPDYPIINVAESGCMTIPPVVATRLLNWLTQKNTFGFANGIYFLRMENRYRALIEANGDVLQIERNNISD